MWAGDRATAVQFEQSAVSSFDDLKLVVADKAQPIFGKWEQTVQHLVFRPIVALTPGLTYQLIRGDQVLLAFRVPMLQKLRPKLVSIYPSGDTVPENLLKIHLVFDQTMGEQRSDRFIKMTLNNGDTMPHVFLPLHPELWNQRQDRLTVWIDPGRLKRALGPNEAWGQPFTQGQRIQLHILPGWKSHAGILLKPVEVKEFVVGVADRAVPNPEKWQMDLPTSQTRQTLKIDLGKPMDFILARECISVLMDDQLVPGSVDLEDHESTWCFIPEMPWRSGKYQVEIAARLEDLAGNNLTRLFDREIDGPRPTVDHFNFHYLDFEIR